MNTQERQTKTYAWTTLNDQVRKIIMEKSESDPLNPPPENTAMQPLQRDPDGKVYGKRPLKDHAEKPLSGHMSSESDSSMIAQVHLGEGSENKRSRKESPTPDHLSVKSGASIIAPIHFGQDQLSMKSGASIIAPIHFGQEQLSTKNDASIIAPIHFRQVELSRKSAHSTVQPTHFHQVDQSKDTSEVKETGKELQICQQHHRTLCMFCKTDVIPICKECAIQEHREHKKQYIEIPNVPDTPTSLEKMLGSMTASEFHGFKKSLRIEFPECFQRLHVDCNTSHVVERMMECFSEDKVLKVALQLSSANPLYKCQEKIKEKLSRTYRHIREGLALPRTQAVLHDIYTELYITEGGSDGIKEEHEMREIEKAYKNHAKQETPVNLKEIFKVPSRPSDYIRTVLTKGIAGIGKTVCVQKFILDWAENNTNQDIDLILPLFFRDLNLEKDCSMTGLLKRYFPDLKHIESIENGIKVLLILDGLDECRLSLDFKNVPMCSDIMETTSLSMLLTNLIKGNLLPNALLWITSRPAATRQIPSEYIQRITEVRGFSDPEKEEYFQKKCASSDLANTMIKYVKSSPVLHMMCHIPIFCWITATILDIILRDPVVGEIPKNQTQLYSHFLLIQIGLKNRRYRRIMYEDLKLSPSDREMILTLAKLAFEGVQNDNLVFYEDDLKQCGIDINEASEFSSLCTQLFREEFGLYKQRVFCFLHLSIQEHLAAVHVLCMYVNEGINVFDLHGPAKGTTQQSAFTDVLKTAVVKTLENNDGHFDQFLRFLLGLSDESSQKLLRGLLHKSGKQFQKNDEIVRFIEEKIAEENITENQAMNLFHCLNEMNHNSLVKDIAERLDTHTLSELKPEECSALTFVLLMSDKVMEEFDLKKYNTNQSGRHRLLPIVRASQKAILSDCELSVNACESVATSLRIANSPVRVLDLSNNNLGDSGLKIFTEGLKSPHCRLEILRLSSCNITGISCKDLVTALQKSDSQLLELDLSLNKLTDSGVQLLDPWLRSERCKLQKLGLRRCCLTINYCSILVPFWSSTRQIYLDLRENDTKE